MKNEKSMRIQFLKWFFAVMFILGAAYLFLGQLFLPDEMADTFAACKVLDTEWMLIKEDGTKEAFEIPGKYDAGHNELVSIETILPDEFVYGDYLCFWSLRQDVKIYIDGVLRREYSTRDTRLFGKTSSAAYIFVEIRPEDAGKTLLVETQTDSNYSGVFRNVYIGDRLGIWEYTFQKYGTEIVVAFLMIIFSVIGIVSGMLLRFVYRKSSSLEFLSWGVLLAAMWLLGNSVFRQIFFRNLSVISDITFFCIMLMPFPFIFYINIVQKGRYQKQYAVVGLLAAVNLVGCSILQIINVKDFTETIVLTELVCVFVILFMAGTIVRDCVTGEVNEYRLAAIGLLGVFLSAVGQISLYALQLNVPFSGIFIALGLIFLMTATAISAVREVMRTEQEKNRAIYANESKAQFLANMSHEIRTPINAVLGMDEIILRECEQENIREYALDIQSAGRNLLSLINDILDFSKIDSGKMELVSAKYDLASLINDCYSMISMRAKEKNLKLILENTSSLPKYLCGDEVRIRQIIINLLTNAVKYTKEGTVTLSVDGVYSEEKFQLRIIVKDTGIGIREEDQGKLFDSFQRVDEKRNRSIEGTGLGLAITKKFTDLMGGKISVSSTYGKGSEFKVEIPQKIVSEEMIENISGRYREEKRSEKREKLIAPDGRILVVDDVEMNLKVICGLLEKTRLQIDTASSGKECLAMLQQKTYHIIFLDHMMPEMDGVETFHQMKQLPDNKNKETPVVMLTANAIMGAKEEYLLEGFSDYLSKPVRIEQLEHMVKKYLPQELVLREEREKTDNPLAAVDFLDKKTGMMYCANSEELYVMVLEKYLADQKADILSEMYEKEEWEKYRIQIHAVKSMSLSIGAGDLSEEARRLEMAAKEHDVVYIKENHEKFMVAYVSLLEKLQEIFSL